VNENRLAVTIPALQNLARSGESERAENRHRASSTRVVDDGVVAELGDASRVCAGQIFDEEILAALGVVMTTVRGC
jgi:hypothetical protein